MEIRHSIATAPPRVLPLTHVELRRRIRSLPGTLGLFRPAAMGGPLFHPAATRPRWIRPADLVRRMRPYLSQN